MATKRSAQDRNPKGVLIGLGALVAALVGLVVWSLPGQAPTPADDHDAEVQASLHPDAGAARDREKNTGSLDALPEATCELAILTDKSPDELRAIDADAIGKLLDAKTCGSGCDAVKKAVQQKDHVELEVSTADDYILPPKEAFEAMAPSLTSAERDSIDKRPNVLVVRSRFTPSIDQLAARTCFAVAASVGNKLDGLIYDETSRRFETPAGVAQHAVTAAPGQPVFTPRMIAIQLYKQDDGTARLVSLGMARFGSPDFVIRGASMDEGPALANVMNVVAWHAAALDGKLPLTVTMADLSRATGFVAARLSKDPAASKPLRLEVVDSERQEGDPDNEVVELVPPGGATVEAWSDGLAALYGEKPRIVRVGDDPKLEEAAKRARASLPTAIRRWKDGEGDLYVKGPFPIPGKEDAGAASSEWMWLGVTSCDAKSCSGTLSNDPGYATNLSAGKPVSVTRDKTADWLLRLKDGGTAGGESIRILEQR